MRRFVRPLVLIRPPQDSLSERISEYLTQTPPFSRFHFAVAWARQRGVELIAEALEKYAGHSVGIVGLNQRGTSYEALYALHERLEELWVFYKHRFQTFHPKMYLFLPNPDSEGQKAVTVIGSSNLTSGGLDTNFEVSWLQELAPNVTRDQATLAEIQHYFQDLIASPFCHRVDSTDFLDKLLNERYIRLEKSLRAETSQSMQRQAGRSPVASLPEAPPPRIKGYHPIHVPTPNGFPLTKDANNDINLCVHTDDTRGFPMSKKKQKSQRFDMQMDIETRLSTRRAILCDILDEYTAIVESRFGVKRSPLYKLQNSSLTNPHLYESVGSKMKSRKSRRSDIEMTKEDLGGGAVRYKMLHKPTGEYYFMEWHPFEPHGKIGVTSYERGTLSASRWRKLQQSMVANMPSQKPI